MVGTWKLRGGIKEEMVRSPCCEKMGLKRGPWTAEEDVILISYIQRYGHGNWRALPKQAGLLRCGKSCRLRWTNYLRPDIKRGNFTVEEEETIIKLHQMLGNRWSAIAARLPGRTDNEIKNVWHTHLKKRLDPNNLNPNRNPKSKTRRQKSDSDSTPDTESKQTIPTSSGESSVKNEDDSGDFRSERFFEIDESFWSEALEDSERLLLFSDDDVLVDGGDYEMDFLMKVMEEIRELAEL